MQDIRHAPEGAETSGTRVAAEIARFDRIADDWWDPQGKFRPLHQLNPLRVGYIRARAATHFARDVAAAQPLAGLDILDIGCGGGLVAEALSRLGARVVGIDASAEAVRVAESHAQRSGVDTRYRCAAPEDLLADGATFDVVVTMEVVEHVADLDAFIRASAALLRPGGAIIIATLNRTLKSLLLAKIGAEYVLRWLPVGTHDWQKFVRPSELARNLRTHGFDVRDAVGAAYDPLQGSWSYSRDLSVNYFVFATKPEPSPR